MSDAQLRRARKRWGDKAAVQKRRAGRWPNGACSVCCKQGCRRKYAMTVGVVDGIMGIKLFLHVRGQGHTWKEAWANADEHEREALANTAKREKQGSA